MEPISLQKCFSKLTMHSDPFNLYTYELGDIVTPSPHLQMKLWLGNMTLISSVYPTGQGQSRNRH